MKPKIILQGVYYPEDIYIEFSKCSQRKIDANIERLIDKKWREFEKAKKAIEGMIWDSVTYRLDDLKKENGVITIILGEILFSKRIGARWFVDELEKLGQEYYPSGIYIVAIVKTCDDLYIAGRLSGKTIVTDHISLVGGALSKDEMAIHDAMDIFESLYKELKEELNISKSSIKNTYLQAIVQTERLSFGFVFNVELHTNAQDVKNAFMSNDEIIGVEIYTKNEMKGVLHTMGDVKKLIAEIM